MARRTIRVNGIAIAAVSATTGRQNASSLIAMKPKASTNDKRNKLPSRAPRTSFRDRYVHVTVLTAIQVQENHEVVQP